MCTGNGKPGSVEHVVVVWLKDPGNPTARRRIIDASQVLRSISGVMSLKAGTMIPSQRPVVDSSFDIALSVTFIPHESHIPLGFASSAQPNCYCVCVK